jgi:pSer/pThr/pTyr-binding forkhead associated (FHA) protein
MSARHCELSVEAGAVMLRDLDSSNGTIVNGVPVLAGQRYRLDEGDLIRIGDTELMVAFLEGERPPGLPSATSRESR